MKGSLLVIERSRLSVMINTILTTLYIRLANLYPVLLLIVSLQEACFYSETLYFIQVAIYVNTLHVTYWEGSPTVWPIGECVIILDKYIFLEAVSRLT